MRLLLQLHQQLLAAACPLQLLKQAHNTMLAAKQYNRQYFTVDIAWLCVRLCTVSLLHRLTSAVYTSMSLTAAYHMAQRLIALARRCQAYCGLGPQGFKACGLEHFEHCAKEPVTQGLMDSNVNVMVQE